MVLSNGVFAFKDYKVKYYTMNITYEFGLFRDSVFKNENGEEVSFESIKDNFYKMNGRKGKIYYKGYTTIYEHGYSGGYDDYGFVYQEDLKTETLGTKVLLEYCNE